LTVKWCGKRSDANILSEAELADAKFAENREKRTLIASAKGKGGNQMDCPPGLGQRDLAGYVLLVPYKKGKGWVEALRGKVRAGKTISPEGKGEGRRGRGDLANLQAQKKKKQFRCHHLGGGKESNLTKT